VPGKKLCIHNFTDPVFEHLEGYDVCAFTSGRQDLRTAITADHVDIVVIDLDTPDALDTIVEIREIDSRVAVIGVLGVNDVQKCISAQRAGCSQITPKPLNEDDLIVAIRQALNEATEPVEMGKCIAVLGSSGGSGATTLVCYLAMSLAELSNCSASIIDADFEFGTVAKLWDVNPRFTIADFAGGSDGLLLEEVVLELPCGIGLLPRPRQIEEGQAIDEARMKRVLQATRGAYSHVVIDLPRKLDAVAGCIIQECEKLIVVVELTVVGIYNAGRLNDALNRFGIPPETVEFVVNRYHKNVHSLSVDALERTVGKKALGVVPNHYKSILEANDMGQPVSGRNPVRKAIAEIAAKLCRVQPKKPQGGWMSNLGLRLGSGKAN
jgi:pilus assembly protein CpaE